MDFNEGRSWEMQFAFAENKVCEIGQGINASILKESSVGKWLNIYRKVWAD